MTHGRTDFNKNDSEIFNRAKEEFAATKNRQPFSSADFKAVSARATEMKGCYVCTGGEKPNVCAGHLAEANERAAKYNIPAIEALWQLRQEQEDPNVRG